MVIEVDMSVKIYLQVKSSLLNEYLIVTIAGHCYKINNIDTSNSQFQSLQCFQSGEHL
jgi:hypothetical protein